MTDSNFNAYTQTNDPTISTQDTFSNAALDMSTDPNAVNTDTDALFPNSADSAQPGVAELSEEDKEFEKKFEKFYRRRFPGFTMSSGVNMLGHGRGELLLTTDTKQCIHFYEQGNCKIGSRNSIELKTGDQATEDDLSIFLSAENGAIKISAPNGNLILQGENVLLESTAADGQVTIKSKKNMYLDSTSLTVDTDYGTVAACSDLLLYGGNDTLLYCESGPPETAGGGDPILASGLVGKILAAMKNAKMLFVSGAI